MAQTISYHNVDVPATTTGHTVGAASDGNDSVLTRAEAQEAFAAALAAGIPPDKVVLSFGGTNYVQADIAGLPTTLPATPLRNRSSALVGVGVHHSWLKGTGDNAHDGRMYGARITGEHSFNDYVAIGWGVPLGGLQLDRTFTGPDGSDLTSKVDPTFYTGIDVELHIRPLQFDYFRNLYVALRGGFLVMPSVQTPGDNFSTPETNPDFVCPDNLSPLECDLIRGQATLGGAAGPQAVNLNNSGFMNPDNNAVNHASGIGAEVHLGAGLGNLFPLYQGGGLDLSLNYNHRWMFLPTASGDTAELRAHEVGLQLTWLLDAVRPDDGGGIGIYPHGYTRGDSYVATDVRLHKTGASAAMVHDVAVGDNLNEFSIIASVAGGTEFPAGSTYQVKVNGVDVGAPVDIAGQGTITLGDLPVTAANAGQTITVVINDGSGTPITLTLNVAAVAAAPTVVDPAVTGLGAAGAAGTFAQEIDGKPTTISGVVISGTNLRIGNLKIEDPTTGDINLPNVDVPIPADVLSGGTAQVVVTATGTGPQIVVEFRKSGTAAGDPADYTATFNGTTAFSTPVASGPTAPPAIAGAALAGAPAGGVEAGTALTAAINLQTPAALPANATIRITRPDATTRDIAAGAAPTNPLRLFDSGASLVAGAYTVSYSLPAAPTVFTDITILNVRVAGGAAIPALGAVPAMTAGAVSAAGIQVPTTIALPANSQVILRPVGGGADVTINVTTAGNSFIPIPGGTNLVQGQYTIIYKETSAGSENNIGSITVSPAPVSAAVPDLSATQARRSGGVVTARVSIPAGATIQAGDQIHVYRVGRSTATPSNLAGAEVLRGSAAGSGTFNLDPATHTGGSTFDVTIGNGASRQVNVGATVVSDKLVMVLYRDGVAVDYLGTMVKPRGGGSNPWE